MILCTLNFLVFCFVLLSQLHVIRQLPARGSDQLESLSSFGHCPGGGGGGEGGTSL